MRCRRWRLTTRAPVLLCVCVCVCVLACSTVFEVLDKDGSGDVGAAELMELIQTNTDESAEVAMMTQDVVRSLDRDGDGAISTEEFSAVMKAQPVLWEAFARSMPGLGVERMQIKQNGGDKKFTFDRLQEVFQEERRRRLESGRADRLEYNVRGALRSTARARVCVFRSVDSSACVGVYVCLFSSTAAGVPYVRLLSCSARVLLQQRQRATVRLAAQTPVQ